MTSHISHIHDNIYFMLSLDHPTNITKISWGVKWPPQAAGHFFLIPPQKKHGFQQLSAAKSTNSQLKKWASCPISDLQDLLCYCMFTYFLEWQAPIKSLWALPEVRSNFQQHRCCSWKTNPTRSGMHKIKLHSRNNSLPLGTLRISGISAIKKSFHRTNFIV